MECSNHAGRAPTAQLKHRGSSWSVRRRWNRNTLGVQFPEPTARSCKVTSNQNLHLSTWKTLMLPANTLQQRNGPKTYGFNHPPTNNDHNKWKTIGSYITVIYISLKKTTPIAGKSATSPSTHRSWIVESWHDVNFNFKAQIDGTFLFQHLL